MANFDIFWLFLSLISAFTGCMSWYLVRKRQPDKHNLIGVIEKKKEINFAFEIDTKIV